MAMKPQNLISKEDKTEPNKEANNLKVKSKNEHKITPQGGKEKEDNWTTLAHLLSVKKLNRKQSKRLQT